MDGTAIMQGVATGFIAQAYGIALAFGDYLMVILTATLASIGTAAVPSAGLITLAVAKSGGWFDRNVFDADDGDPDPALNVRPE